jgi:hypothetical protein
MRGRRREAWNNPNKTFPRLMPARKTSRMLWEPCLIIAATLAAEAIREVHACVGWYAHSDDFCNRVLGNG